MKKSNPKRKLAVEISFLNAVASKLFLYPLTNEKKYILYGQYLIYSLVVLTIIQLVLTLYLFGLKNLIEFTNIAPNIGVCVIAVLKYDVVTKNKAFYKKFFQHFGDHIWTKIHDNSLENHKTASTYIFIMKFMNRFFVFYSLPLIVIVDSFPWLIMKIENKVLGKELKHLYPFDGWYPFDKISWFYAVYFWESLMTGIVVVMHMYSDMCNLFVVCCICMELRFLGHGFKNLVKDDDIKEILAVTNIERIHRELKVKLRDLIIRHKFLNGLCKELDAMLGDIMLVNYTFGSVFVTLTAFTFTVVNDLFQSIRCFSFCLSLVLVVLDYCTIGQIISDHSVQLADDIYSSNWIYADVKTKKTIMILIMRMQKPFKLTANGIISMDLKTFTSIMGSSYQLFNLLRSVHNTNDM